MRLEKLEESIGYRFKNKLILKMHLHIHHMQMKIMYKVMKN